MTSHNLCSKMVQMARHPISDNAWRCCLNLQLLLINLSANDNLMTGRQTPLTHGHMYALSRCPWLTCHGQQRDCVAGRLGLQCVLCAFFDSCSRTIHAHDGLFEVNNIRRPALFPLTIYFFSFRNFFQLQRGGQAQGPPLNMPLLCTALS